MAIDVRIKNGGEDQSRVLFHPKNAETFRRICRFTKKKPDALLEAMIRLYVKTEGLEIEIVEERGLRKAK